MALGQKRDITFTDLRPGSYTLRVKGSNNDGVWNEEGVSLAIRVVAPLWQTWWFRLSGLLALSLLLLGGYKQRTHAMRACNRELGAVNATLHDEITQRKEAEKELETSQEEIKAKNKELETSDVPQLRRQPRPTRQ